MEKNTRPVEMYVGYMDHTWDTMMIDIPADTPNRRGLITIIAVKKALQMLEQAGRNDVAFVGRYHLPPLEDLEDLNEPE